MNVITKQVYRDGMARLVTAVNVITSDGPAGPGGFTASAVCSVTDDPPTLLICVNLSSRQADILHGNGILCVNTLADSQGAVGARFANHDLTIDERFQGATWTTLATGAPVLDGALVSFDCRIVERLERRTHAVILCEIEAVRIEAGAEPLVYFGRGYRSLMDVPATI